MNKRATLEALGVFVAATLAMTWPLPLELTRALPGDLGDPLLNGYLLSWGEKHLTAFLRGDLGAFSAWWQANIFYPAPYALAYSEHLFAEIVMGWPVWIATHNVILLYNLLFLASFVLSGLGMVLLARELTGNDSAALVAGLCFAFLPYRFSQIPHIQVMSSQWMPWTLYAFRRYFETKSPRALAGAGIALAAQQLSCGYYLVYFTPVVASYLVWEVTARRAWRDGFLLASLAATIAVDLLAVWPFLQPYLELRRLGFPPRTLNEIASYSADVRGYATASAMNRLWGSWLHFRFWTEAENELFPGGVLTAAAAVGCLTYLRRQSNAPGGNTGTERERPVVGALGILVAVMILAAMVVLWTGGVTLSASRVPLLRLRDVPRTLTVLAVLVAALLALSHQARALVRITTDLRPWAVIVLVAAFVLSLGPEPRTNGRGLGFDGPYVWLYEFVPGFDGLRVPARFAMIVYLCLAVLAAYGLARLPSRWRSVPAVWALGLLVLFETAAAPLTLNAVWSSTEVADPPAVVLPEAQAPEVYRMLARMPRGTVVAEFPFGFQGWELQYVFYASVHEQPLLNGYSGGFPDSYSTNADRLAHPLEHTDAAWQTLRANGVKVVIVHRRGYRPGEAEPVMAWLRGHGAEHVATAREAELFGIP